MNVNFTQDTGLALTPDFYSSIVRHGSELITVLSWEGIYQYASDSISTILGFDREELLGTDVMHHMHPDDLATVREELYKLTYGGVKQIALSPFRYRAKNGDWHWLSCVATNMLDNPHVQGIVTNSRDVTSNMEALQHKKESQAYYKALFFNNPDLVATLNLNGQIEACNEAVITLTGYSRKDDANRHFTDYVLQEYLPVAYGAFEKALQGESCTFEICINTLEGYKRHLTATLVPVILEGRVRALQCLAKDTTSEKEAHMLVQTQAQKLHNILESMTEGFFALDSDWRYSFGNKVFAKFLNRNLEDLMQRHIWEEYPWLLDTLFYQKCSEVAATRKPVVFDETMCDMKVTLRFSLNPFEGGILVSFVDITEQIAAQEELRKLSLVASKTTNGVIITNNDARIEWVNEAFTKVTGYTLEEIKGHRPSEFLASPDTDPNEIIWIREQLTKGIPMRKEQRGYKKNGDLIWSDITISPISNDKGEVIKHVYIHTDITERKLDQEQLLKATEHLYLQNQDLQQFNYIVSHNLRAPVANLVGLSTMLQKLEPNGPRFELGLQNLEKSARRLDDVISDLNKILAVRAANVDEARELVRVPEVAAEVIQSLQHLLDQAGGSIQLDLSDEDMLWASRAYVYSILHNLITNAIKYKSGLRELLIELTSVRDKYGLRLQVRDNGSGMDLNVVRPRLFQLYRRFHAGPEGKGIGLYLVKMQVGAIGGKIEVDSQPEAGTIFTIQFDQAAYGQQGIHN
ncbi:PAS domain S-box protein [uncultured Pontibacter sp.]|uniref:PAS domain S-box protein n=1 Tax=uncultured Pontibacter sp. TaxID=453356 RepID=UPI00261D979A|nr:PAS domain S-box protein [uncultured Pontibacter sp.]